MNGTFINNRGGSDPGNKGYFIDSTALIAAYPVGVAGRWATVGNGAFPATIWLRDDESSIRVNSGTIAGALTYQNLTVTTPGQTVFPLTSAPISLDEGLLFVNGVKYTYTVDFTVVGLTLTWLDNGFTLNTTDVVEYIF